MPTRPSRSPLLHRGPAHEATPTAGRSARRPRSRRLLSGITLASMIAAGTSFAPATSATAAEPLAIAAAAPTPTPARVGPPASMAVLGDSISQATGSDDGGGTVAGQDAGTGTVRPENSWATGNWPGLNSNFQRIRALPGSAGLTRVNLAANGANMKNNFLAQAQTVAAGTAYVMVEMGGNDLCRPTEAEMTSEADYRAQFRAGLQWLRDNRPETLVFVASVPDIYNLWYIRGAAHQGEYFGVWPFGSTAAGPRPARGAEDNGTFLARQFWDGLFGSVIPCKSLLVDPTNPRNAGPTPTASHASEARRLRVRARTIAFNNILTQECAAVLRCSFDDNALFNFSSNRLSNGLLNGNSSQWAFRDRDISTQDHFHPSFTGQQKLADNTFKASYDFTDRTAPVTTVTPGTAANGKGWHRANVAVTSSATDAGGIRGFESRVHQPGGAVGAWAPTIAPTGPSFNVGTEGTSHVEVRSLDSNGNRSASRILTVNLDKTLPQAAPVTPAAGAAFVQHAKVTADYSCSDAGGSQVASCVGTVPNGSNIDTSSVGTKSFSVTATDGAGNQRTVTRSYTVIDVTPTGIDITTPAADASFDRHQEAEADYACSDEVGGSGLKTCVGTVADGAPVPTGAIGDHDFTVDATDNAGNAASLTRTYTVLDVTAPTISLSTPADGAVYDHNQVVNAAYTCEDEEGGSGVAAGYCEGTVDAGAAIDTTTLGNHTFTVTSTDGAGNEATVTHTYTVRDVTAPTVSSPHRGIEYKLGEPVQAQFTCTDEQGGSGVATCTGPASLDTGSVGSKTFTVTTTDNAGNQRTETFGYRVTYAYGDVRQPINRDGSSVFKAGSTVPVKFSVTDFDNAPVGTAGARLVAVRTYNSDGALPDELQEEAVANVSATSGNLFRYDAGERQYIYNLSTKGMKAGSYQLVIELNDGKQYTAIINLR